MKNNSEKNVKLGLLAQERVIQFQKVFEKESPEIRDELAKTLPAFNLLLNCHAKTFEEFALLPIAKENGFDFKDPLFDYKVLKPICPKCKCSEHVIRKKDNKYECKRHDFFAANHDSLSSDSKIPSVTWMQVLICILEFYSVKRTCDYCNITRTTFYNIRNKLFYAMQILLDELRLYGEIQADNTIVHISFRGMELLDNDYPEDSIFYEEDFIPRAPRARGGSYSYAEKNKNSLCIFTAIDDSGHTYTKLVDIGQTNTQTLLKKVSAEKFLERVPLNDPFLYTKETALNDEKKFKPGEYSLFVSDKEGALYKFAESIGLKTENHVYRKNGRQRRLANGSHNIQRVNQVHKKLKDFLRKSNFVSSKYLPGYLVLFDFVENTGASKEAIGRLFEILAMPGFGVKKEFFNTLYQTPNYIVEWAQKDNALQRFPHMQLYACYRYAQLRDAKEKGITPVFYLKDISEETGYSPCTIRRHYKNFKSSGLLQKICKHFDDNDEEQLNDEIKKAIKKSKRFTPEMLIVYDEYVEFRKTPKCDRTTIAEFFASMNQKYNMKYSLAFWQKICGEISCSGIKEPLPVLINSKNLVSGYTPSEQKRAEKYLKMYEEIERRYSSKNEPVPEQSVILQELSEKLKRSTYTIRDAVLLGRKIRRETHD